MIRGQKRWGKGMALLLTALLLVSGAAKSLPVLAGGQEAKTVDILFTSDVHSHLDSFETLFQGEQENIGGFARMKTLIDDRRKKIRTRCTWMAGRFSMGTLVQTV